jgi:hypothetical protein
MQWRSIDHGLSGAGRMARHAHIPPAANRTYFFEVATKLRHEQVFVVMRRMG